MDVLSICQGFFFSSFGIQASLRSCDLLSQQPVYINSINRNVNWCIMHIFDIIKNHYSQEMIDREKNNYLEEFYDLLRPVMFIFM